MKQFFDKDFFLSKNSNKSLQKDEEFDFTHEIKKRRRFSNILDELMEKDRFQQPISQEWLKELKEQPMLMGVVIILKEKALTLKQIVQKLKPSFQFVDKKNPDEKLTQKVQNCLQTYKKKLFNYNEQNLKWSLNEQGNYFESLEKKIKQKKKKKQTINQRKRNFEIYDDVMQKLMETLEFFQKNNFKTYKIIKTNPFKRINKIKKQQSPEKFQEEILYNLVRSEDSQNQGQRIIGILQCFYYFYPLMKDLKKDQMITLQKINQKLEKTVEQLEKKIKQFVKKLIFLTLHGRLIGGQNYLKKMENCKINRQRTSLLNLYLLKNQNQQFLCNQS